MNIVQKADEWMMSHVQSCAWRIQSRHEIDHVEIARACFAAGFSCLALIGVLSGSLVFTVFIIVVTVGAYLLIGSRFNRAGHRPDMRNPHRDRWEDRVFRSTFIACVFTFLGYALLHDKDVPLIVAGAIITSSIACEIATFYFISCDPMPPRYAEDEKNLALSPT